MITIEEYTDELETENRTLYEDKNYWKRLAEKRNYQLQQKENIIKEVREYMKTLSDEYAKDDYDIKCDVFNKLYYEILDKGE